MSRVSTTIKVPAPLPPRLYFSPSPPHSRTFACCLHLFVGIAKAQLHIAGDELLCGRHDLVDRRVPSALFEVVNVTGGDNAEELAADLAAVCGNEEGETVSGVNGDSLSRHCAVNAPVMGMPPKPRCCLISAISRTVIFGPRTTGSTIKPCLYRCVVGKGYGMRLRLEIELTDQGTTSGMAACVSLP